MLGFSILETIIVLAIFAIVLTFSLPNTDYFMSETQTREAANLFSAAINRTREEAIARNTLVSLCKSSTGTQCTSNGGYEQGFIIFTNPDSDLKVDSNETILHRHNQSLESLTIRGLGSFKNRITYKPSGDSTAFSRIVICSHKRLYSAMLIFINASGKPRIAPDANRNRIPEDYNNQDIDSCLTDITIVD
jgi:type IV fimbrial biogenesis protein FimT